jgi:hypothetical protein
MKLGVSYNLFDGEELLEYSIASIKPNVDYISVVMQEVSNHGAQCNPGLLQYLKDLKDKNIINDICIYKPTFSGDPLQASLNETYKRNVGLELSKRNNCTHHMSMDTDEFYTNDQFRYMKSKIEKENLDTGFCQHCQYYKDSIYILKNKEQEYVPTIEKIHPTTKYIYKEKPSVPTDPTRQTTNTKQYLFNRNEVEMHHMSFVRKNIKRKLDNSSCRRHFTESQIEKITEYYKNWKFPQPAMWAGGNLLEVIKVPRLFEIYQVETST